MGLFDFFDKEKKTERMLQKSEKKLTNMYMQAAERQYVVQELRDMGTPEAVWVLLQRYKENNPNTTLDIEEKELIYDTLVRMAARSEAGVVGEVKRFVLESEVKINWPMKVLSDLLPLDEYIGFVIEILQTCDTEYQKTTEKKQEILLRSTELNDPALAAEVARFVSDDNETIRFLAVEAALNQSSADVVSEALFTQFVEEDSLRIVQKIMAVLPDRRDLIVPDELVDQVSEILTGDLGVHKQGYIYRRRR